MKAREGEKRTGSYAHIGSGTSGIAIKQSLRPEIKEKNMLPFSEKNVYLAGEPYARALKNYSRLHDAYYRPGIIGREPFAASKDWPGDWEGRTILALSLHAGTLHTCPAFLDKIVDDIMSICNEDGYRGPKVDYDAINEQLYPSHSWLMRGLIEYYKLTRRNDILDWINRILDHLFLPLLPHLDHYPVSKSDREACTDGEAIGAVQGTFKQWRLSSDIGCIFIPLDGLTAAYELTHRSDLLPLINKTILLFRSTDCVENKLQTHASLTFMRGVMRMWRLTGDASLLEMAKKIFADYKRYGMTPFWANLNWFMRFSWTEPCAVIDSYMLAHQLWEATGESCYLNDSQMILYNGMYRGQRPNGGFGCDCTGENDVLEIRKQTYEAYWCCTMRGGEGLGYLARTAVYKDGNTLLFPVFADMKIDAGFAEIYESSAYPYSGKVTFRIEEGDGSRRTIKLFAPVRGNNFRVCINGMTTEYVYADGFISFETSMLPNTEILYTFDLTLHTEPVTGVLYTGRNRCSLLYGTLLLATDKPHSEKPDLASVERTGEREWRAGSIILKPISEAYLMENEALKAACLGLCFRI